MEMRRNDDSSQPVRQRPVELDSQLIFQELLPLCEQFGDDPSIPGSQMRKDTRCIAPREDLGEAAFDVSAHSAGQSRVSSGADQIAARIAEQT